MIFTWVWVQLRVWNRMSCKMASSSFSIITLRLLCFPLLEDLPSSNCACDVFVVTTFSTFQVLTCSTSLHWWQDKKKSQPRAALISEKQIAQKSCWCEQCKLKRIWTDVLLFPGSCSEMMLWVQLQQVREGMTLFNVWTKLFGQSKFFNGSFKVDRLFVFVVLLLLDVCSRFEIASPTGYKKGTQKNYFYNRPFFGPLLDETRLL